MPEDEEGLETSLEGDVERREADAVGVLAGWHMCTVQLLQEE
jgi:hypothetical protein